MRLFIGCSSSDSLDSEIVSDCRELVEEIASIPGVDLVYGAYNQGLMGVCYDAFQKQGKKIIGVTPKIYEDDIDSFLLDEFYLTDTTIERFHKIYEESDVFLFLPGGIGTFSEFFNAVEEHRTMKDDKRIILYNGTYFYTPMIKELYHLYQEGFIEQELASCFVIEQDKETVKKLIKEMK